MYLVRYRNEAGRLVFVDARLDYMRTAVCIADDLMEDGYSDVEIINTEHSTWTELPFAKTENVLFFGRSVKCSTSLTN